MFNSLYFFNIESTTVLPIFVPRYPRLKGRKYTNHNDTKSLAEQLCKRLDIEEHFEILLTTLSLFVWISTFSNSWTLYLIFSNNFISLSVERACWFLLPAFPREFDELLVRQRRQVYSFFPKWKKCRPFQTSDSSINMFLALIRFRLLPPRCCSTHNGVPMLNWTNDVQCFS